MLSRQILQRKQKIRRRLSSMCVLILSNRGLLHDYEPSCGPSFQALIKAVKTFKNSCTTTFSNCRQKEDDSVELVYTCGSGDIQSSTSSRLL